MLKKRQRITSKEFSRVLKKNTTRHSENFTVRLVNGTPGRAAVIVSKKVAKSAVLRNTIKRKIRSAVSSLLTNTQMTILVYAKEGASQLSVEEMTLELRALIQPV